MKKIFIMAFVCILMTALLILPASASCDECMNVEATYDWSAHCDAKCTCSWGPCGYCNDSDSYLEDFCGATHEYEWSNPSDTTHEGVCACGKVVEGDCDMVVISSVDPGCVDAGFRTTKCNVCGVEMRETLLATGHNWVETFVEDPVCDNVGKRHFECSICGETQVDTIEALGHAYSETVTAPSCTTGGWTTHTCSRCGDSYADSETPATGHSMKAVKTTHATCTTNGQIDKECEHCGETDVEVLEALGHDYSVPQVIAPTCTAKGYTKNVCSRCDAYEIVEGSETEILPHSWEETDRDEPTCTAPGIQRYECSVCGESKAESIEALGHAYSATVIAPSCTTGGWTTHICLRCEDAYVDSQLDPLGHDFIEGVCFICGAIRDNPPFETDPSETFPPIIDPGVPDVPDQGDLDDNRLDKNNAESMEVHVFLFRVVGIIGAVTVIVYALSPDTNKRRRRRKRR